MSAIQLTKNAERLEFRAIAARCRPPRSLLICVKPFDQQTRKLGAHMIFSRNHKGELMNGTRLTAIVAGAVLAAAIGSSAVAQQRPGYGPGPGYGHGPGMMGGHSRGDGHGMMGQHGAGQGHGGYAHGAGLAALNLTDEQREKVARIQEENRSKNWNTMGQVRGEMFKLREMYSGDKLDSNAISEQQRKVDELRRQMLKANIETRNQVAAILTPEQRQQFRSFGPWWAPETAE